MVFEIIVCFYFLLLINTLIHFNDPLGDKLRAFLILFVGKHFLIVTLTDVYQSSLDRYFVHRVTYLCFLILLAVCWFSIHAYTSRLIPCEVGRDNRAPYAIDARRFRVLVTSNSVVNRRSSLDIIFRGLSLLNLSYKKHYLTKIDYHHLGKTSIENNQTR